MTAFESVGRDATSSKNTGLGWLAKSTMSPLKKLIAILAVVVVAGGCSCSTEQYVESSDEVTVTLTEVEPAMEGDLVVRINGRVRGAQWDEKVDGDVAGLEDWFDLQIALTPAVEGARVSLVPVDGPESIFARTVHMAGDGYEAVPVEEWHLVERTSFLDGGTFDFACPVETSCEVVFRYRIEMVVPPEAGEGVEVSAEALLAVNELGPGGQRPRPDGAEMTVTLLPPQPAEPIVEAFEIGTVPVADRKHRGRLEVPVTVRFPELTQAEVVRFVTRADPEVRFVQDDEVIRGRGWDKTHLRELPLMVGDCGDDGCIVRGRLLTEVEPDAGKVTFWAYVRDGWDLHAPSSDLALEVELAPEALPTQPGIANDPDD